MKKARSLFRDRDFGLIHVRACLVRLREAPTRKSAPFSAYFLLVNTPRLTSWTRLLLEASVLTPSIGKASPTPTA